MVIQCPNNGATVYVAGQGSGSGSGSGSGGTICVRGTVNDGDTEGSIIYAPMVRVRLVLGIVNPPYPPAEPKYPGDVDVTPIGQNWCAHNMPVPSGTGHGSAVTALAWELQPDGIWSPAQRACFTAGGTGAVDCCVGCVPLGGTEFAATASAFQNWPPPPPPLPPNITDSQV